MPEMEVNGVRINYRVVGDGGPWLALNPGSRRDYTELEDLAGKIAAKGFRVLLHDRRNCGASEVAFEGHASEHEIWADDLYALARGLGATPLYVGGASAGARLAILLTLRHPESVKGMVLWRVTGGQTAADRLAKNYYTDFIDLVRAGGMEAVAGSEHFAGRIAARPSNRERILAQDPDAFVEVMETWRQYFLEAARLPIIGATEEQLAAVTVPVCIIAGNDVVHQPQTARRIAQILPRAELHEDVVRRLPDDQLLQKWSEEEWREQEDRLVAIFAGFLERAEGR